MEWVGRGGERSYKKKKKKFFKRRRIDILIEDMVY